MVGENETSYQPGTRRLSWGIPECYSARGWIRVARVDSEEGTLLTLTPPAEVIHKTRLIPGTLLT